MRKINELLALGPGAAVSPAEQAMLIAHFNKPAEKEPGPLMTVYLATKGAAKNKAAAIKSLAEEERKREELEKNLTSQINELKKQLEATAKAK